LKLQLEPLIMASSLKGNPEVEVVPDLTSITGDIAALKRDLAQLMRHLKLDATETTRTAPRSAVDEIGGEAMRAYETLAAQGERSVQAIGRQVEEQPIMSLLLAFAVGLLGSRMLSR
jgi:hypothetical protein